MPKHIAKESHIRKTPETELLHATSSDNIDAVRDLLKANPGIDINTKSQGGNTPLVLAAINDNSEMIKLLISKGAKPAIRGSRDRTAYEWAVSLYNKDAIETLRKYEQDADGDDIKEKLRR